MLSCEPTQESPSTAKRGRNFESPGEAYWPLFGSSCVVTDRPSINGVRRAAGPEQRLSVSTMEVVVLLCHDLRRSLHIHMCTVVLHSTPVLLRQVGEQSRESHDSSYMACAPPLFGLSLLASLTHQVLADHPLERKLVVALLRVAGAPRG